VVPEVVTAVERSPPGWGLATSLVVSVPTVGVNDASVHPAYAAATASD
jgi:hypothetical protein